MRIRASVLRLKDYAKMPWANGKGVTYEMGRRDHGDSYGGASPFLWRMSQALLAPGLSEFSSIAGVDRCLTLIEGSGASLTVDSNTSELQLHQPFFFAADSLTMCDGPIDGGRNFNVMWDRKAFSATVDVVENHVVVPKGADVCFAVSLDGPLSLVVGNRSILLAESGECARFDYEPGQNRVCEQDRDWKEDGNIHVLEGRACVASLIPQDAKDDGMP